MNILDINEPFYSAGKKFGWTGGSPGLGINSALLEGEGEIQVRVLKKPTIYSIEKSKARELVKQYNAYHLARSTQLSVVPWHEFKTIKL